MLTATHRTALGTSTLALALGLLAGCGGHGSSVSGAGSSFRILTLSVPNNGIWQINRPIELTFDQDVDFSSVNLNTINITQLNGAPAAGEFRLKSSKVVVFQPACPTQADFSDAGFRPNGVQYRINVLGSSQGGPTVRSTAGRPLTSSQVVDFRTPVSALLDPTILFIDPQLGPPGAVVRTDSNNLAASYIELGGDSSVAGRRYFEPRVVPAPDLGADVPAGFEAPLNLYSDGSTRVVVVLALNQPVDPSANNVNPDNVRLEYEKQDGTWEALAHTVALTVNCNGTGSEIRVTPTGILPQGRRVRTVLSSNFKDLVGDFNIVPIVVGTFVVDVATDPGTSTAGDGGDAKSETFSLSGTQVGSFEDVNSVLATPRAVWGQDGKLEASFAFDGTGGAPDGQFDWVVDGTFVLDTSFALITDATQTRQQTVVNGRVDIRSLWVKPTGILIIQGVNPCTILCSGKLPPNLLPAGTADSGVLIQGLVKCSGTNNRGVVSFATANIPEQGAAGQVGGGDGGTGNYLTTQSTPQGGPGFGPFGAASGGGQGGESGFNPNGDTLRRPGGGGGGRLNAAQMERSRPTCPDQRMIGLDAEAGFNGAPTSTGALHPGVPIGGAVGPRPFVDTDPNNDFWGTMVTAAGAVIRGELPNPSAGAGGGGGGSACPTASFPTTPFTVTGDEKGAGGGGGGGSLRILALGDIRFGGLGAASRGRIECNGGTGGGGENTNGINRIGGGSGGGSGGHLILQSASQIDLSRCTSVSTTINGATAWGGLFARGGQGGEGDTGSGGARANGVETIPAVDALPPNSYPTTAPAGPCAIVDLANDAANTVGGFAVPVQFHFTNVVGNANPTNPKICC
ncbi:MAG: hypothetical protein HZA53_00115, partial [Planctomycetes bacterium]|nr:hypothetical protein [Planctomycetota bacterium]